MSGEKVNEASLISGSSGPVSFHHHLSHFNITVVAGESSRDGNSKKILQDSSDLLEKEVFQNILRDVEHQLAEGDGDSAIERVEDFLSKASRSAMNVKNMADYLKGKGQYVQAMILYKISHDLHKKEGKFSPDDELDWIWDRNLDIHEVIIPLIEAGGTSRKIAIKIAVKFLKPFLEESHEVKNADPNRRAWVESVCCARISSVHFLTHELEECIRFCEYALSIMTQQFGANAFYHDLFGRLMYNLGSAYHISGRYSDAERYHIKAIEIYTMASDFEDEKQRVVNIALSRLALEETRGMIANQK